MHVMIDEPNEEVDRAIANHIVAVHQLKTEALAATYTMEDMQRYIKYARAIRPEMSDEVLQRPPPPPPPAPPFFSCFLLIAPLLMPLLPP